MFRVAERVGTPNAQAPLVSGKQEHAHVETRRQIPASHGQPLDARHFTIFALACVLVVSMFGLVGTEVDFAAREEAHQIDVQTP